MNEIQQIAKEISSMLEHCYCSGDDYTAPHYSPRALTYLVEFVNRIAEMTEEDKKE